MPEQRLHDVERLAAADELHGDGMAKRMRLGAPGEGHAGPGEPAPHVVIERSRREGVAVVVEPHRLVKAWPAAGARTSTREIRLDGKHHFGGKWAVPIDVAFADNPHVRILDVQHEVAKAPAA